MWGGSAAPTGLGGRGARAEAVEGGGTGKGASGEALLRTVSSARAGLEGGWGGGRELAVVTFAFLF